MTFLSIFRNELNTFYDIGVRMIDSIYHMALMHMALFHSQTRRHIMIK